MRQESDDGAFVPTQFMLVPTMACQAACTYCFSRKASESMSPEVTDAALDFIERVAPRKDTIRVTFHGGEPLLAGARYFLHALSGLRERFGRRAQIALQSNLWMLTDELAALFAQYEVTVGTSVDGPADLNDAQRGFGAYADTTRGIDLLRRHRVRVGTICTLSAPYAYRAAQVYRQARQPYALHGAVPALGMPRSDAYVSVAQMRQVLLASYEAYKESPAHARITTIDAMAQGVLERRGVACTFCDCLGSFAAIAPDGGIYPCQRFCGVEEYRLGNVLDAPRVSDLRCGDAFARLVAARDAKNRACVSCEHEPYCHGGCLYDALAAKTEKDPYCDAYAATFDRILHDMALEMGSRLLREDAPAPVLAMAGDGVHPYDARLQRERVRLALEKGASSESFARDHLRGRHPENDLNKLYLHLTFSCPLHCSHCYARAGERSCPELTATQFAGIVRDACDARFRSVVVTGGEPMVYGEFDGLCARLAQLDTKGTQLVLRTSLGFFVPKDRLRAAMDVFDEVVVSVDGNRATHDERRGPGTYDAAVANLQAIADWGLAQKLSLAATLSHELSRGAAGRSVEELAASLGIPKVRIRPVLPLGRADGAQREGWSSCMDDPCACGMRLRHTCGLGQNLYVEPDGQAYPCYAWCAPDKRLGSLGQESLHDLLARGDLYAYCEHDVDANEKCHTCEVRYLCGGMCRAWVRDRSNVDSGDFECASLHALLTSRAERFLSART